VEIDGNSVWAARFGTTYKQTQYPDQEFERLVTHDGEIIVKTPDQEYKFSGQNVYKVDVDESPDYEKKSKILL